MSACPHIPPQSCSEEIYQFDSDPSEVRHARTARARGAIAHLIGRLTALLSRPILPLQPLSRLSASVYALSAGTGRHRRRASALLGVPKLALRCAPAAAPPARRQSALAACLAARRPAHWRACC